MNLGYFSAGIVAILAIFFGAASFIYKPTESTPNGDLPPGTTGLPLIGETIGLLFGSHDQLTAQYAMYGPVSRTFVLGIDAILLGGREGARLFYDGEKITRENHMLANMQKLLPNAVNSKNGDAFRVAKNIVVAAIRPRVIDKAVPQITLLAQAALEALRGKQQFSFAQVIQKWNFDALCVLLLSDVQNSIRDDYMALINDAVGGLPIGHPFSSFSRPNRKLLDILAWLEQQVDMHTANPGKYAGDGLSEMIQASKTGSSPLSNYDLACELHHLFVAGLMINSPFGNFLQDLEKYPDLKKNVIREVKGANIAIADSDAKKSFPMLISSYMESMRLGHSVKFIPGTSKIDFNYTTFTGDTYFIPKGWWVLLMVHSVGTDPEVYTRPAEFKPDRYLNQDPLDAQLSFQSVVHGGGPFLPYSSWSGHACPGQGLHIHLMLILVNAMIRGGYNWKLADAASPPTADFISLPTDGILMESF